MDDLKTIFGVIVFGGMALLLIIMFSLYLYARDKRLENERVQKIRIDKQNEAIRKIEDKLILEVARTRRQAIYNDGTTLIRVWPGKKRFY